jgi:solute:Na+ symporter, SSS family
MMGMPIFWMITMWYRRMRYLSLAEFFSERYGSQRMAAFYAVTQTLMFMIVAATGFTAMSKTIAAIAEKPVAALSHVELAERELALEWQELRTKDFRTLTADEQRRLHDLSELQPQSSFSYINRTYLTIALAIIILLYAVSGGLEAAFITDMIQGIFIIVLTLMLIPFAMLRINELYGQEGSWDRFAPSTKTCRRRSFRCLARHRSPSLPGTTFWRLDS